MYFKGVYLSRVYGKGVKGSVEVIFSFFLGFEGYGVGYFVVWFFFEFKEVE